MKVFYHNDLDGRCAAAIVHRKLGTNDTPAETYIEMDYKDIVAVEDIEEDELIIIVDFSFKPAEMEKVLGKTKEIIWLDHHKTAFEYRYSGPNIPGIRDEAFSGCELAWQYFFRNDRMPRAVELIGDYDKWALKYQPACFVFYEGLKLRVNNPQAPIWNCLLSNTNTAMNLTTTICEEGKLAIQYRDNYCENLRKSYGYETEIDGHKAYATNFYMFGPKGFGPLREQYPICIAYIHDGKQFTISLYSEKIDVSVIAKKHGGGGHRGAAGFVCPELPFRK